MRVAILFEYASLNGGERSFLATVSRLQRQGVEFCGVAPANGALTKALMQGDVETISWPNGIHDPSGRKRSQEAIRSQIREVITRWRPDLIHANSLSMARSLGPLAEQLAIPCIGHLRDILRLNRTVIRDLNANDRLLAVSRATRDHHVAQGIEASRIFLVHNGVELPRFNPGKCTGEIHRELEIPPNARLILTIGQIGIRKGLDVGFNALRDLFGANESLHWLIVGQRHSAKQEAVEYEQALRKASLEPPFHGRVHWLGLRSDVPRLMRESQILLHLARQEPLGRVLLEGAASGMAVVATRVGGTFEIFGRDTSDSAARLVAPDAPDATATAVADFLNNEDLRQELGVRAARRAAERFSAAKAARELMTQYQLVVSATK